MGDITGGALSFTADLDHDKFVKAAEEAERRIQGLSDATVAGGKAMDLAMIKTAEDIEKAFSVIDALSENNKAALKSLEAEYKRLGEEAGKALNKGDDADVTPLMMRQQAIKGEIIMRKQVIADIDEQADALAKLDAKMEAERKKTEESTKSVTSYRGQLRLAKEELIAMEAAGQRGTAEYAKKQAHAGDLADAMSDAQAQAAILSNDQRGFQGIITGLSGVSGGFSAAAGAVGLFAGESEDLQLIMLKVQSLMAITIGLQEVSQMLDKDSAFQLVTLNGLKEWWAGIVAQATIAETAETVAIAANTAATTAQAAVTGEGAAVKAADALATEAQTVAAVTGTAANLTLAGAFRAVGAAIMSIPVLGWIIAGLTALGAGVAYYYSQAQAAKKAQEELTKAIVDGCYKPIGAIESLSAKYAALGNDFKAKEKFIKDNQKAFDDLGVAITGVADAENLLIKNKDAFIAAQIAKAKAAVITKEGEEKVKELIKAQRDLEQAKKTPKKWVSAGGDGDGDFVENPAIQAAKNRVIILNSDIKKLYSSAADIEKEAADGMTKASIASTKSYAEGSIGALEKAISDKQVALKELTDPKKRKSEVKEIEKMQKQLDAMQGKKSTTATAKDPYQEGLDKKKKAYQEYYKWMNSSDEALQKAAKSNFADTLKGGASYLDYLKKQRDAIENDSKGTPNKTQKHQLGLINNQIAEETKKTVLESFNNDLTEQMNSAKSIMAMLKIIEDKRKELKGDGSELEQAKGEKLDEEEKNVMGKAKEETDALMANYEDYLNKKARKAIEFEEQISLLQSKADKSTSAEEKEKIKGAIYMYRKLKEAGIESFDEMNELNEDSLSRLGSYEQNRLKIIESYEKQIAAARISNNEELARKLEGARDIELMQESQQYQEFFGDVSDVSIKTLETTRTTLLKMMEEAYKAGEMTYAQYKELVDKVNRQMDEAYQGRGIEALFGNSKGAGVANLAFGEGDIGSKISSFKSVFNGAKTDASSIAGSTGKAAGAMGDVAGKAGGALTIIDAIVKAVYQTLAAVSDTMETIADLKESEGDSKGADKLRNTASLIKVVNNSTNETWQKLKNGDVMGSMMQSLMTIVKLKTELNKQHDQKIQNSIAEHAEKVNKLETAYRQLEAAIDDALGTDVYAAQEEAIANLKKQQQEVIAMKEEEATKKNSDSGKIDEYQNQYDDLGLKIQDTMKAIREEILQTNAKDLAKDLGDALVEAFSMGEDAAHAFGETADKIIRNAVLNQLKKQFLEKQLQGALDGLYASMNGNTNVTASNGGRPSSSNSSTTDNAGRRPEARSGRRPSTSTNHANPEAIKAAEAAKTAAKAPTFKFDGLTDDEIDKFKNNIETISINFQNELNAFDELFKDTEAIKEELLQINAEGFADDLSSALVDAFANGEDAAVAFGNVADNVVKNAVLRQLKDEFLKNQLQGALDNLYESMGGNGADFNFDGLTDAEIAAFKANVADISKNFQDKLNGYSKLFGGLGDSTLTGAIKGITEEQASMLGGQTNAIRINQVEANSIMRQQLGTLHLISTHSYTQVQLQKQILAQLSKTQPDPSRPFGITQSDRIKKRI